jgi:hypothetical protein
MARHLVRKNLIVDGEQLRELARRRGTSESAAVREVIDFALAAEEVKEIIHEIRERGGIEDVFGRLSESDGQ